MSVEHFQTEANFKLTAHCTPEMTREEASQDPMADLSRTDATGTWAWGWGLWSPGGSTL